MPMADGNQVYEAASRFQVTLNQFHAYHPLSQTHSLPLALIMDLTDEARRARSEAQARARLDLFMAIHGEVTRHLPTILGEVNVRYEAASNASLLHLQNDITMLRSDMSFLPHKLKQVQIDRLSPRELNKFASQLTQLLGFLDRVVKDMAVPMVGSDPEVNFEGQSFS